MNRTLSIIFIFILIEEVSAQTGGGRAYEFLNISQSGLITSLGGMNVSLPVKDPALALNNPSLLSSSMDKSISLNYVNYFAGINYGMAIYSMSVPKIGSIAAGLTCLDYGKITGADISGNITGSFGASEYSFSLIYSLRIDSLFSLGINIKPVLSHLERYTSFGMAADIGAGWRSEDELFSAGIVLRNIGGQITTYAGEKRHFAPFEIQAGISAKLTHAPFRFSFTIRHLEKFDLTHEYGTNEKSELDASSSEFMENLMRHFIIGAELIPHRNFYLSAGYNYQRRKELQTESRMAGVGFSWGFGINTSILSVGFGRASYHLAGTSNNISLIIRPNNLLKRVPKKNSTDFVF